MKLKNICFIGAGNVATHLSIGLYDQGYCIRQIISKTKRSAYNLSVKTNSESSDNILDLKENADLYILAIPDHTISNISAQLSTKISSKSIIVHCSGSQDTKCFESIFDQYGVIYPLQSLSKDVDTDLSKIPFCVTGNTKHVEAFLVDVAKSLSDSVTVLPDSKRLQLHLAAVFANNFSNHMIAIAKKLCNEHEIDFEFLKPLIRETFRKIERTSPEVAQTGPAVREDANTINKHLHILKNQSLTKLVYLICTESIQKFNHESLL